MCPETAKMSEEAAGAGEPSQMPSDINVAGTWGEPGPEAWGHRAARGCRMAPWDRSVLDRSSVDPCCQLARVLGKASLPTLWAAEPPQGAYPFLRPCTCKSLVFQGRSYFLEGTSSPWGPVSNMGCLGFLECGGLGGLPALLHAWQRARRAVSPASSAHDRPWECYFPAADWSLETWPRWLRSYSCGLSLATLESGVRDFSSPVQSGGLACDAAYQELLSLG